MYDHFIALDWAQSNMAISRMTRGSDQVKTVNVPSSIKELQLYLSRLKGKKILTFEETTTSQWLFVELKDFVDELLICDPYRNHLLSEGAKTDEIDAEKLVKLLKTGLLKPVFHSADTFIVLRKLISGYEDLVKAGVRLKNQRSALLRAGGKSKRDTVEFPVERFVVAGLDRGITNYEAEKERYETEMEKLTKKHVVLRHLDQIHGIGQIGAVKIAARVVDAGRFGDKGKWLSYCGLVRLEKMSGGRSYGWKQPRYCRTLKSVFKTAALSVISDHAKNPFKEYYEFLLAQKHYPEAQARNAVARKIAVVAWAVMKSGKKFEPGKMFKKTEKIGQAF